MSDLFTAGMGTEEIVKNMDVSNWHSTLAYDQWVALSVSGPKPLARYKHAAAVANEKLYIAGGSRNGRYMSDVQVFDLKSLVWSNLKLKAESDAGEVEENSSHEVLPATAGHNMVKWGSKLLLLGGHSKTSADSLTVRFIDLETNLCGVLQTSGKVPEARVGQSATLFGSRLILFGGENRRRRLLNDVHVLDLETMTWNEVEGTQTPPAPRFDHTAALHAERYLLIFGGCSHSIFFNDLHVLDLQTMEWSQPEIQGDLVTPRAGHAGVAVDEKWYIVGGGDNKNGCPETFVLNMSKLIWSALTTIKERDPLASEGLSICSALINGEKHLVSFGGYNGRYNNEVFVMRLKPTDTARPKIFQSPAAAAAAASVTAAYALAKSEKLDFLEMENSSLKGTSNASSEDMKIAVDAIKEEKRAIELSLEEVRAENSVLRGKIEEVAGTHVELSKELQSVQSQLAAETSRCSKLEAQITELQKMLESLQAIENEVQLLRKEKSEQEQMESSALEKQNSGGVWRWIAG